MFRNCILFVILSILFSGIVYACDYQDVFLIDLIKSREEKKLVAKRYQCMEVKNNNMIFSNNNEDRVVIPVNSPRYDVIDILVYREKKE